MAQRSLRDRRVPLQRGDYRGAAARRARRARGGRRSPTRTSRSCACRARSRFRSPRSGWPRAASSTPIVCLGCLIKGDTMHFEYIADGRVARDHAGGRGDGRADGVRRADDDDRRAGGGASRRRAPATRDAKRRRPRSRWPRCSASSTKAIGGMTAERRAAIGARPETESRHRAREAALQMLYQWEVGRASMPRSAQTFWTHGPAATRAAERRPAGVRDDAGDRRRRHGRGHRSDDRRGGGELAHRADERARSADPAAGDLRIPARAGDAGEGRSSTKRWSWRAPSAPTTRCGSSTACSTRSAAR